MEYVDSNGRPVHGEKHGGGTDRSHSVKVASRGTVRAIDRAAAARQSCCIYIATYIEQRVCHLGNFCSGVQIDVDFPYEVLTGVSGCYRAAHGGSPPVVRSVTFATSRGTVHGPFGDADADGVPFSYPMEGGVVVGFTGRSGWHLDALGLYVAALRPETLRDVVQERGLMAYRSFVYGESGMPGRRAITTAGGRSSGATNNCIRLRVAGRSGSTSTDGRVKCSFFNLAGEGASRFPYGV